MERRELEICAETLQACEAAGVGGADRIELCSALETGGVTPSHALIQAACAASRVPVHVLVRPRAGSFVYTDAELAVMCADVEEALELGAAGIVTGVLDAGGRVEVRRMRRLVDAAGGKPVTFHRAIDMVADGRRALEEVIACGCARVLTSGGEPTVVQGEARLREMVEQAAGRVTIAAGGGVTIETAMQLRGILGLDFHASLRRKGERREGAVDPLWRDAAEGVLAVDDVRRLAEIVHGG